MQAIILCGGKGERLNSLTVNSPKGMINIEGKPILEYQIEWLKRHGVNHIIFACGYLHEQIQDYFGDGKQFSIKMDYSIEEQQLGRGGAIKQAWSKLKPGEKVIVTNGDIYTLMDLKKALSIHVEKEKANKIKATICLFPYKSSYGIVKTNKDGLIESFDEKPDLPFWINGGIYIFEYDVKDSFPDKGDHETSTFPEFVKRGLIFGYTSKEYWRSIETVKDVNEFSKDIRGQLLV
jgi:NDP-sugar pyrophosphorylase family protein